MIRSTPSLCIAVLLAFASALSAASFLDDFSLDTSSDYKATDTNGSGGMFTISGGTLNLSPAGSNTHDVFHKTARLEVGEFVRVTVPAGTVKDFFLTASTTDRGPNTGSEDGIRFVLASTARSKVGFIVMERQQLHLMRAPLRGGPAT